MTELSDIKRELEKVNTNLKDLKDFTKEIKLFSLAQAEYNKRMNITLQELLRLKREEIKNGIQNKSSD